MTAAAPAPAPCRVFGYNLNALLPENFNLADALVVADWFSRSKQICHSSGCHALLLAQVQRMALQEQRA